MSTQAQARLALALLNIQPGEGNLVALLVAQSLCVGVARSLAETASESLFLARFGAQSLPYFYVAMGITTVFAGLLYARLAQRLTFTRLLVATFTALILSALVLRIMLALPDAGWATFAAPVWSEVLAALLSVSFWAQASRLLNVRQGKRLFGVIGTGEVIAAIGAGLLTPVLVGIAGAPNLLLISASGVAGTLAFGVALSRSYVAGSSDGPAETQRVPDAAARPSRKVSYREMLRSGQILLIFLFSFLLWFAIIFVDNIFYFPTSSRYPSSDQMAAFLGIFNAAAGALTLVVRALFTGRIVSRFGIGAGLLAWPFAVGLGTASLAAAGTLGATGAPIFWLAAITKLSDKVLRRSTNQSSLQMLYQPLPPEHRLIAQTTTETFANPLAIVSAGLGLLILIRGLGFGVTELSYIAFAMVLGMYILSVLLSRGYPAALMRALSRRKLDAATLSLADRSSLQVVKQALGSPHVGVVLFALDKIEQAERGEYAALLPQVLQHPALEVRLEALARIERLGLTEAIEDVRRVAASDASMQVRGAAIRVLAALGEEQVFDELLAYLHDPDPAVKRGAMVGLLRSGGIMGVLAAGESLVELERSRQPTRRAFAAQVIGDVGIQSFYQPLLPMLTDRDLPVRAAAIVAAGKLKNPRLWPPVVDNLAVAKVSALAADALVAGGEPVVPELRQAFLAGNYEAEGSKQKAASRRQPDLPPSAFRLLPPSSVLARMARICGRIGGQAATEMLEGHMGFPVEDVRAQVLAALRMCGYRATGDAVPHVLKQINREAEGAAGILAALADIGEGLEVALLRSALAYRFGLARDRLLYLLSFIYDPAVVMQARDSLSHASREQRAYAIELLDVLISQDLKSKLFPLLEDLPPNERLAQVGAQFPQRGLGLQDRLRELAALPEGHLHPWVGTCAEYALYLIERSANGPGPNGSAALAAHTQRVSSDGKAANAGSEKPVGAVREPPPQPGDAAMLSMIEKVLVLKGVSIFAGTPDEVLAQLAPLLDEVEMPAGQIVINKGDIGTYMYIIAEGHLRVHDGDRVINEIGEGEVFGEMAVLDPAPRSASVTALEDARLLRLDQEPFYELMADHVEVAQGVIQVLARRLRALLQDAPNVPATDGPPYALEPLTQTQTPTTPTGDMEGGLHATH